ncbi:hypothetical protein D5S18_23590 [Nocardia panacis]|uniref:Uncharacterized protein n=1 Tax=Nocardia panacis TaxID=2340916 RepID=A0A3A4JYA6_9NOCA|nr:hypothetical protein [Nocardia panacis]RJO72153.1 hypothetical protein D5S18_23590 [Nocardia panacis]
MSAADEIEAIVEHHRRTMARLSEEFEESRSRMNAGSEELFAAMRRVEAEAEEQAREEAEARAAIARATAARKANDTIQPIDDDDEESAYYRRDSWLV